MSTADNKLSIPLRLDGRRVMVAPGADLRIKAVLLDANGVRDYIRVKVGKEGHVIHVSHQDVAAAFGEQKVVRDPEDPQILGGDIVEATGSMVIDGHCIGLGEILTVDHRAPSGLPCFGFAPDVPWPAEGFRLVGQRRRDGSGWFDWHGGSNPAPGQRVEVEKRSGLTFDSNSDGLVWTQAGAVSATDIVAFRLTNACTARENDHAVAAIDALGNGGLDSAVLGKPMLRDYAAAELAEAAARDAKRRDNGVVWIREGDGVTIGATVIREPGAFGEFLTARIGDKHDGEPFDIQVRVTDLASHHPRKLQVGDEIHNARVDKAHRGLPGTLKAIVEIDGEEIAVVDFPNIPGFGVGPLAGFVRTPPA